MPSPPPSRPPAEAPQRIAKLLARAGVASRREVERMVAEGRVALDGAAVETPATLLYTLAGVTVDGRPIEAPAPARLFLYNKPAGLLVTERDPGGRPTIYDRLPRGLPRVVPVGRLDLSTEGLLLLTTDGGLKRQLELPATGVERVYRARAYGHVTQAMLEELITGIEIDGIRYGPIDANLERRTGTNVWIELKLTEGKNREVRRVLDHLGLRVSRLIRTRYGPFALGDLPPGEVAEVRPHDIASFRKNPTRLDLPQAPQRPSPRPTPVLQPVLPTGAAAPRPKLDRPAPAAAHPRASSGRRPAAARAETAEPVAVAKPARAARARAFREATGKSDAAPNRGVGAPAARPAKAGAPPSRPPKAGAPKHAGAGGKQSPGRSPKERGARPPRRPGR